MFVFLKHLRIFSPNGPKDLEEQNESFWLRDRKDKVVVRNVVLYNQDMFSNKDDFLFSPLSYRPTGTRARRGF